MRLSDINLTLGIFYFSNSLKDASLLALWEITDGSTAQGAQGSYYELVFKVDEFNCIHLYVETRAQNYYDSNLI